MLKACIGIPTVLLGAMSFAWAADSCCSSGAAAACDMPAPMAAATQPTTRPAAGDVYVCPMGCETSDKPGKCSKCGMTLVKKDIKSDAGAMHDHSHAK